MNQEDFLVWVAQSLETVGIPFMVTGSLGSSYHGQARSTQDVDLVIDPTSAQLDNFLTQIAERAYVSPEAAREALRRRSLFNIIDFEEGWKADLIIRKDRPFSIEEFQRRSIETLFGHSLPIASPEDVILSKLEWNKLTPSERQVNDALHVVVVQGPRLDQVYLRKWASILGIADQLETILLKAATP